MHDVSVEALDAQVDQAHGVRSVLWAVSHLLSRRATDARQQALLFELHQLTATGLRLADELIESMQADRPVHSQPTPSPSRSRCEA